MLIIEAPMLQSFEGSGSTVLNSLIVEVSLRLSESYNLDRILQVKVSDRIGIGH